MPIFNKHHHTAASRSTAMFKASNVRLFQSSRPFYSSNLTGFKSSITVLRRIQSNLGGLETEVEDYLTGKSPVPPNKRFVRKCREAITNTELYMKKTRWQLLQIGANESASDAPPPISTANQQVLTYERDPAAFTAHKNFVQQLVGYTFQDDTWLKQALSVRWNRYGDSSLSQQQLRLALVGDANIKVVYYSHNVAYGGTKSFCGNVNALECNNSLTYCAEIWGLAALVLNWGYPSLKDRSSAQWFGTLVEAIIGAVYLDSAHSYAPTKQAILRLLSYTEKSREEGTALDPEVLASRNIPARPDRRHR